MGLLANRLTDWLGGKRSGTINPAQWLVDWVSGGPSSAGVKVSHKTALRYTPFWAGVRIISGTIAALPFLVYQRLEDGGKTRVPSHPIYRLLHDRPNPYMDAVTFIETRQAHVLCYGNGYAEIQRNGAGKPVALWPLLPDRTSRKIKDGVPYYEVQVTGGEKLSLRDENVLHIKGLGFDGYTGYDVVAYHKEALGYGIGVKEYGARFFANGATLSGTLEHPSSLTDKAYDRLKKSWAATHEGLSNAHRMQILEEGMKWNAHGVDPRKAQALEVQKFTVDDVSRIFNIPPHKLGSMEFSKYNNVEQLAIDFVTTTMVYWFTKWEQECGYKLLGPEDRRKMFCEILADGLLRGNVEARTKYYEAGRRWGFLSINDIRAKENMNPIGPGGDVYLDPLNMTPAGTLPARPSAGLAGGDDDDLDAVRAAHRELIVEQWRRVIGKLTKGRIKGVRPGWWHDQQRWAREVLGPACAAYGSVVGANGHTPEVLQRFCRQWIDPERSLTDDDAPALAEMLMEQIGGSYALSQ